MGVLTIVILCTISGNRLQSSLLISAHNKFRCLLVIYLSVAPFKSMIIWIWSTFCGLYACSHRSNLSRHVTSISFMIHLVIFSGFVLWRSSMSLNWPALTIKMGLPYLSVSWKPIGINSRIASSLPMKSCSKSKSTYIFCLHLVYSTSASKAIFWLNSAAAKNLANTPRVNSIL